MSCYRKMEIFSPSSFLLEENEDFLDLPFFSDFHFQTLIRRVDPVLTHPVESAMTRRQLQTLSDRVAALELALAKPPPPPPPSHRHVAKDTKYTWKAELKDPDRMYKVVAESTKGGKRSYKWTAEIKDSDDVARSYAFKAVSGGEESESGLVKREKKEKREKKGKGKRVVEIEEVGPDHGTVILRQAFAKRDRCRGKRKELSPQDAAMMIQMTFKAYLIRRSQALRALRELAIAKAKLKELRVLFNNFSYRRRVVRDAEERQRFTERIIVVLLTVDSIEGADVMVRAAKRSMTDELEAMLDVVDPQPSGKSRFSKRRTFDMPDGIIQKELAAGVAEVVQMLDQENGTFEACL